MTGLEPATSRVTGEYFHQLSYITMDLHSGGEIRTPSHRGNSTTLYR
jgi:hypothetical protein